MAQNNGVMVWSQFEASMCVCTSERPAVWWSGQRWGSWTEEGRGVSGEKGRGRREKYEKGESKKKDEREIKEMSAL